MKLYFIRHGDPNYTLDCLTELGHRQADELSDHIRNYSIQKIFTSPQGRAIETSKHCLSNFPNVEPVTMPWLRELEWGDLSGNAYATDGPWLKNDSFIATEHAYPSGDSWKTDKRLINDRLIGDVESRIEAFDAFMEDLGYKRENQLYRVNKKSDENIAFFCHGGITTALASHILNIPFWTMIAHFPLDLCGISAINIDAEEGAYTAASLEIYNDHYFTENVTK